MGEKGSSCGGRGARYLGSCCDEVSCQREGKAGSRLAHAVLREQSPLPLLECLLAGRVTAAGVTSTSEGKSIRALAAAQARSCPPRSNRQQRPRRRIHRPPRSTHHIIFSSLQPLPSSPTHHHHPAHHHHHHRHRHRHLHASRSILTSYLRRADLSPAPVADGPRDRPSTAPRAAVRSSHLAS